MKICIFIKPGIKSVLIWQTVYFYYYYYYYYYYY